LIRKRSRRLFLTVLATALLVTSSLFAQSRSAEYARQDSGRFRVFYFPPDAGVVHELWQTLQSRVPTVERSLGLGLADTVAFIIAPNEQEWSRLTSGAPLWANGLAYPDRGFAVLKSPRFGLPYGPFPTTAVHEYVHLLLHAGAPYAAFPRWLDEGLAEVLAGQFDYLDDALLGRAAFANRLHSFDGLDGLMGMSASDARQGYAESAVAVQLLQKKFGLAGVSNLVHDLRAGEPIDQAFPKIFGIGLGAFESEYRDYVKRNYRFAFLGDTELWTAGAFVFLFLVAGVAVWFRRRRTLARWEEEGHREGQTPTGDAPYTINYTIVRSRLHEEGGEQKPEEPEPPHDNPLPGN
jgi:hypothetical protein